LEHTLSVRLRDHHTAVRTPRLGRVARLLAFPGTARDTARIAADQTGLAVAAVRTAGVSDTADVVDGTALTPLGHGAAAHVPTKHVANPGADALHRGIGTLEIFEAVEQGPRGVFQAKPAIPAIKAVRSRRADPLPYAGLAGIAFTVLQA